VKKSQLVILLSSLALLAGCKGGDTPSSDPSVNPSVAPSVAPSVNPSVAPSVEPSVNPSVTPSVEPSVAPSVNPSVTPSVEPSGGPAPSIEPSADPEPSIEPSQEPEPVGPTLNAKYLYKNNDIGDDCILEFYYDEEEEKNIVKYYETRDRRYSVINGTYSFIEDNKWQIDFEHSYEDIDGSIFSHDFVRTFDVQITETNAYTKFFSDDYLEFELYTGYIPSEEETQGGQYVPVYHGLGEIVGKYMSDSGEYQIYLDFYKVDDKQFLDLINVNKAEGTYIKAMTQYEMISAPENLYSVKAFWSYQNVKGNVYENRYDQEAKVKVTTTGVTFFYNEDSSVEFTAIAGNIPTEREVCYNETFFEDKDPTQYIPYEGSYLDATYLVQTKSSLNLYFITFTPENTVMIEREGNGIYFRDTGTYTIGENNSLDIKLNHIYKHWYGQEIEEASYGPKTYNGVIVDEDHVYLDPYFSTQHYVAHRYEGYVPTEDDVMNSYVDPTTPATYLKARYINKNMLPDSNMIIDSVLILNEDNRCYYTVYSNNMYSDMSGTYTYDGYDTVFMHFTYMHTHIDDNISNEIISKNVNLNIENENIAYLEDGSAYLTQHILYTGEIARESEVFDPEYKATMLIPGPVMVAKAISEGDVTTQYINFTADGDVEYYVVNDDMFHSKWGTYEGNNGEFIITFTGEYIHQAGQDPINNEIEVQNRIVFLEDEVNFYGEDDVSFVVFNYYGGALPED